MMRLVGLLLSVVFFVFSMSQAGAAPPATVRIDAPMAPPNWALLQRELLRASAAACKEFFDRYFDERGYLLCVERWGGDDGPDDAIENCADWPLLHALGASDQVLVLYKKAWEGHLRQYTQAKTSQVPFAREGMYYKEFPVMFDWLHNGEGLRAFYQQALSEPHDGLHRQRTRRYAGFYLNEDPEAPNYDPRQRIIRSLFNGSRGPLLRRATALDWAGDPIDVGKRFKPLHGERSYEEMLAHFKDYNDIVGDNPLNLLATNMALSAYMFGQEKKYRSWLLEYVDAWRERALENGGIIPSNIGLDGKLGGGAGGKWYGGVYGWGFTVLDAVTKRPVHRNNHHLGFVGFRNAYLLTGDDRYLDVWRKQIDKVNAQKKVVDGQTLYPRMFGDQGWYHFLPEKYSPNALELYCLSAKPEDRARVPPDPWLDYLEGKAPTYPEESLRREFALLRARVAGMRQDPTTPDTRLADDPMRFNPAAIKALTELTLGGLPPGRQGGLLLCRLRYFDPVARRAGLPEGVAVLIEKLTDREVTVQLVNVDQLKAREVVVQGGAYGEHQITGVLLGDQDLPVGASSFRVRLAPGSGGRLTVRMQRFVNQPTVAFPWE
jgi:hypothetical protein